MQKNNKWALAGFILSLISIFTFQILVIPILGVVFSAIGLSTFDPAIHKAKWMAIAGLIIGILYTLMGSLELLRAVGYI